MKTTLKNIFLLLTILSFQGCEDMDDVAPSQSEQINTINTFIWRGLNQYYYWKKDIPNLANNRFANQNALNIFLSGYSQPNNLFDALLFKSKDRFSWIVKDYLELEGQLQGTTKNNGVEFSLSYKAGSTTEIFGFVRYIIPNSDASSKDIKRGDIFYGVNGTPLNINNYQSLLNNSENYTLDLADYDNGKITPNGKSIALTKTELSENPILINKVIESGSYKIGYLMYNGFYSDYDNDLNNAFALLKSQNITDLVLDLRYNGGGSVQTATYLASMITQQNTDKVFSKLQWNNENTASNHNFLFSDKLSDATPINRLNLTKIYILTTKSSASASELIINGLKPYINVIQIGDVTYGKNVGSITLYDSPTFSKKNVNPSHRYAMQPITFGVVNSLDFGDYTNGISPDPAHKLKENLSDLGILGNTSEPLLSTAIGNITAVAKLIKQNKGKEFKYFEDSKSMKGQNQMYLEKIP